MFRAGSRSSLRGRVSSVLGDLWSVSRQRKLRVEALEDRRLLSVVADYGDAPAPYPTLAADTGAYHIPAGPTLGANRDVETDGQPSLAADGDDLTGTPDDEDGVTFGSIRVGQTDAIVTVNVQNAPSGAKLDAWIDFNADGSWGGAGERIASGLGVVEGDNAVEFDVPSWAASGETYGRFRLSTAGNLAPGGVAYDGEVEDHLVSILPPVVSSGFFGPLQEIMTYAGAPTSVFAADLDGDGDQDAISSSYSDGKIAWYENLGGGIFGNQQVIVTGTRARSVFAADLDGDGDQDVLSGFANRVAWYENDGTGNFGNEQRITLSNVDSVFAADLDGDGDQDVLFASAQDNEIIWYANSGVGTFNFRQVITTEADGALSVFAADMDGDGDMDVLSASFADDKIAWYENTGEGTFGAQQVITRDADYAASVFATDLDGDGDQDVLSASGYDDKIAWYENTGGGTFGSQQVITTDADYARSVFAADLDGDGDQDVLSASGEDDKIAWYENLGGGIFGNQQVVTTDANAARSVFAADLDGDGDREVLSASAGDHKIAWYDNDGSGNFGSQQIIIASIAIDPTSVFPADLDGDGDLDVVSASSGDDKIAWYENTGGGTFGKQSVVTTNADDARSVFAADLDGDGDKDVLSASAGDDKIAWYENRGGGSFGGQKVITTIADSATSVFAADLDGDGDQDVLSASSRDGKIAWYENIGNGTFGTQRVITMEAEWAQSVFAADLDGDGDLDVLSASYDDDKIAWYENVGGGDFGAQQVITTDVHEAERVSAADLDGDGDQDVLAASSYQLAWYENTGTGTFSAARVISETHSTRRLTTADLDGDGDLDVLSAWYWYENLGGGTIGPRRAIGGMIEAAADVDGDGDLDVLTAASDHVIAWYDNVGNDMGDAPASYATTLADNGARHAALGVRLGALRDSETNGTPSVLADGDDRDDSDDEDGISFGTTLTLGQTATITLNVQNVANWAKVHAWIDFNGNGSWDDPGEQIASILVVEESSVLGQYEEGYNGLQFHVPSWAVVGETYARFRVSKDWDLAPTGPASDGEVEDYRVTILPPALPSAFFGPQQVITIGADGASSVFSADLDGDGDQDVLSGSRYSIAWYENDGNGTFAAHFVTTSGEGTPLAVFANDVDSDGDMDVLWISWNGTIIWHENDGGGNFGIAQVITTDEVHFPGKVSTDLDGDGDLDVLLAAREQGAVWYENDGTGAFSWQHVITMPRSSYYGTRGVYAADLDGDGDQDVLSASGTYPNGTIAWCENNGEGKFGPAQVITTAVDGGSSVFAADLDGDGDLDVLSASQYDDKIAWYENVGFDFGDAPATYPTLAADDGARHVKTGPTLGAYRDEETDGQPTANADGDNANGSADDEDGVAAIPLLAPGIMGTVLTVDASAPSFLNAWIDFNRNGVWESSEQVAVDVPMVAGSNTLSFDVPASAVPGQTYARLRLTSYDTGGTLAPTGPADDGEVEDYAWTIGENVHVDGSANADDVITVRPGVVGVSQHQVSVNGTLTNYDPAVVLAIHIDGLGGNDRITIHGTNQNETVTLQPGSADVVGQTYLIRATNVEDITVNAGSGADQVTMTGSTGSNRLYSYTDYARLADSPRTFSYRVDGFEEVTVEAPGSGRDYAYLYDSPDNDVLDAGPDRVILERAVDTAGATVTTATGFGRAYAYATNGGNDTATLTGEADARNRFYGYADYAILTESRRSFYFYARGFDGVTAESPGSGYTYAYLHDSSGTDALTASPTSATMDRAAGWSDTTANGFKRVYAYSTRGGDDTAELTGSATGGNYYRGYPTYSTLTDSARSFYHYVRGFHSVTAIGSQADTASDRAYLYDSSGADTFVGSGNSAVLRDTAATVYQIEALYFDRVYARSSDRTTNDTVDVDDSLVYNLIRSGTW